MLKLRACYRHHRDIAYSKGRANVQQANQGSAYLSMPITDVGVDTFEENVDFEILFTRGDNKKQDRLALKRSHC